MEEHFDLSLILGESNASQKLKCTSQTNSEEYRTIVKIRNRNGSNHWFLLLILTYISGLAYLRILALACFSVFSPATALTVGASHPLREVEDVKRAKEPTNKVTKSMVLIGHQTINSSEGLMVFCL